MAFRSGYSSVKDPSPSWTALRTGSKEALESIYIEHAPGLYNYGSKFSPDKDLIKDCIQELFVNLWSRRSFLGDTASVKNYLFKAFRHSIFKKKVFYEKYQDLSDDENYDFHVTIAIDDQIIDGETSAKVRERLEATLNKLTARQREAIFLKFYEGRSYEEIAVIMDISVKGTYKVMARAIDTLRGMLKKTDFLLLVLLLSAKIK